MEHTSNFSQIQKKKKKYYWLKCRPYAKLNTEDTYY